MASATVASALPGGRALKTRDKVLRQQFDDAISSYVDGHYTVAETQFRNIVSQPNLSRRGREVAEFMVGKCLYASEAYGVCRNFFAYYIDTYPRSPYVAAAYIESGHCAFRLGETAAAVNAYLSALDADDGTYTPIALANLEPLIMWSLSGTELEILLTSLDNSEKYDWVRFWIADRWHSEGRDRLANDIYRELAYHRTSSEPSRIAGERLDGGSTVPSSRNRLVLGVMAPLTGEFEEFGFDMVRAAQLAAQQFPGHVLIEVYDTHADSSRAVMLVDSVKLQRCDAVIGPLLSDAIAGTVPLFGKQGIPQILPLARRAGYSSAFERTFQMSRPPAEQAHRLAEYAMQTLHLREMAALVSDTPEGRSAGSSFAEVVEWDGGTMYPVQYFKPGDTDFGPQLKALRERTLPPGLTEEEEEDALSYMDGMLVWGDAEDIILIAPQIVFHGFRVYAFGPEGWSDKDALQRMRTSLDSTIFVSYEWVDESRPEWQLFTRDFDAEWHYQPTPLAGRVYDIVSWLGKGIDRDTDARQIVRTLSRDTGYAGATGRWQFDHDGYPTHIPVLHYVNRVIAPIAPN